MPRYNFYCPDHDGEEEQVICFMSEYDSLEKPCCSKCGKEKQRLFSRINTQVDEFDKPMALTTMLSTKTNNPRNLDYAESRSELKRCIDNQERLLGYKVEQAL